MPAILDFSCRQGFSSRFTPIYFHGIMLTALVRRKRIGISQKHLNG